MDPVLEAELRQICEDLGFSLAIEYATQVEMTRAVREIDGMAPDSRLTEPQALALLENLRLVIIKAGRHAFLPSVEAQSRLPRWRFLLAASPEGAAAFAAVLARLALPIPAHLVGGLAR